MTVIIIDWCTYVAESGELVTDVPHGVVGEGGEGVVSGEGVPPGDEGGLSQPVPEHPHPLPLSPKHTARQHRSWQRDSLRQWHIRLNHVTKLQFVLSLDQ